MKYRLTRDVTRKECDWLERDFKNGEVVYQYNGLTYDCIGSRGTACCAEKDKTPFFELPTDALKSHIS